MGRHFWDSGTWFGYRSSRQRSKTLIALGAVLAIGSALPALSHADQLPDVSRPYSDTEQSREADALFEQLLKDPKDVDLILRYAEAAIKAGNIEGGISSLERLLLLNRDFPGVKLQLAELYARIHSYEMAHAYLDQAAREPDIDAQTRTKIQSVRSEIESASSPSKFSSNLLTGLRYQSNASAEPAGSDIIAGGVPQTLSTIFLNKPAWDTFVTGNVEHTYDFGDFKLESNALAYYSKSLGHSILDLAALEINSGPRFNLDVSGTPLVSARPYAVANEVLLGESQFLHSIGAGLEAARPINDKLSGAGFYEFRSEWFSNVALAPAASTLNANVHSFGASLSYQPFEEGRFGFQTSYALTNDFAPFGSSKGLVFHLSYSQLLELPAVLGVGPLDLSPFLYRIYSRNDGPDPTIDPATTAETNEWRYGGGVKLGLTNNIAANLNAVRQISTSNISANRFRDTQIILGLIFAY